jgi:hypothetical protein
VSHVNGRNRNLNRNNLNLAHDQDDAEMSDLGCNVVKLCPFSATDIFLTCVYNQQSTLNTVLQKCISRARVVALAHNANFFRTIDRRTVA